MNTGELAHYTISDVCEKLLFVSKAGTNNKPSPLRLSLAKDTNDPMEGNVLLDFLGVSYKSSVPYFKLNKNHVFISCFSRKINNLDQFKFYGKSENIEDLGAYLISDNSYFLKIKDPYIRLYQVAYIHLFRDDKQIKLPKINGDNPKDFCKTRKDILIDALKELSSYARNNLNKLDEILYSLEYIRYVFKDGCYKGEKEFRLIYKGDLSKAKICEETNKKYFDFFTL